MKKQYNIFIVEDNHFFSGCVGQYLKLKGYTVQSFYKGEEMLRHLDENPDIIILDYYLDEKDKHAVMNGKEVLSELKKNNVKVPVVMLSVEEDVELVIKLLKNGACDYVLKDDNVFANIEKAITSVVQVLDLKNQIDDSRGNIVKGVKRIMVYTVLILSMILMYRYFS